MELTIICITILCAFFIVGAYFRSTAEYRFKIKELETQTKFPAEYWRGKTEVTKMLIARKRDLEFEDVRKIFVTADQLDQLTYTYSTNPEAIE